MSFEYFIAKRYLRSKKRTGLISFTTFFSFIVILFGVACLTTILSIMNGFEAVVLDRFLAFDSHIVVAKKGETPFPDKEDFERRISNIKQIIDFSPYVEGKVILQSEFDKTITTMKGIDLKTIDKVSEIRNKIILGTNDFSMNSQKVEYGIILGRDTADNLLVTVGEEVIVMGTRGLSRAFPQPPVRRFTVTGIFNAEIGEYNFLYSFVSLPDAQRFFRMGREITGYGINTTDIDDSPVVAQLINDEFEDEILVKTWYDLHKNLFLSMRLEKWGALIVLSLMIVVSSFSIASSIIMLVLEKRKEIGILKSMGTTTREIERTFIINGMIIGILGTVIGLILGLGFCLAQLRYEIVMLPTDIYIIDALPININPLDFALVGIIAIFLTFIATILPARAAGRMIPAKALRYE